MGEKFGYQEWIDAVEEAEGYSMCPTDTLEQGSALSHWVATEIDFEAIGEDPEVIKSAALALRVTGEFWFTPDRLLAVLGSYDGERYGPGSGAKAEPKVITVTASVHGVWHRFDSAQW